MKRPLIRLISFILLAVMAVSLVACADNAPEGTPGTSASAVDEGGTSEVPVGETTAVNAENILGPRNFGGAIPNASCKRNVRLTFLYSVNFDEIESGKRGCRSDTAARMSPGALRLRRSIPGFRILQVPQESL